jgi:hypothetical protein
VTEEDLTEALKAADWLAKTPGHVIHSLVRPQPRDL